MKILLTGANGQVGRCLQDVFASSKHQVLLTARTDLDITSDDQVEFCFKEFSPDLVINTAAYTAVDKAEEDTLLAYSVNQHGCEILAKACAKLVIPIIHISTDYVFDGKKSTPYTEMDKVNPQSVYGKSKLAGEEAIIKYASRYCILRTAWVFSEYGSNFLKTMLRLGKSKSALSIVNDQIGRPTYAGDLAQAIVKLLPEIEKSGFQSSIYHYAGDESCSWYEFANEIFRQARDVEFLNREISVSPISSEAYPTLASRPKYSVLSSKKLFEAYGIRPSNWRQAISKVFLCLNKVDVNK